MVKQNSISQNWVITTVGEVYDVIGGGTPSTSISDYWKGKIPWITSADIHGVREIEVSRYVSEQGIKNSATNKVPPKALLVVTRVGLGKIAITECEMCFSQDLQGLVQSLNAIWPEYALYYLSFELQKLKFEGRGTTISGITKKQLKDTQFPLPPYNEQKRIVAKIEALLSELDNGIESLNTAREQLKVYRQAVLKHAFEGKLTATWREKNKDKLEPPDQLLEGIKQLRKAHNRNLTEEWKVDTNHSKPLKLFASEMLPLPDQTGLPFNWCWSTFDNCGDWLGGGTPSKSHPEFWENGDILWVSPKDMKTSNITNTIQKITKTGVDNSSAKIIEKDSVLFVVRSGILRRILPVATAYAGITVNQDMKAMIPYFHDVRFLYWYSIANEYQIRYQCSKDGTTVESIEFGELKKFRCPVTSLVEQKEVVREIERMMSVVEKLEELIDEALSRSEALRQSILKKAFSGKLVAQDESDELASALLERIRAEKETYLANNKSTHQNDVNSDNEYVQDYLIEEASV